MRSQTLLSNLKAVCHLRVAVAVPVTHHRVAHRGAVTTRTGVVEEGAAARVQQAVLRSADELPRDEEGKVLPTAGAGVQRLQ